MRLEFKFRESAPAATRRKVMERVSQHGAQTVEPLFPDETDPELASLYKAEGVPEDESETLVSVLNEIDAVEFAERTPERRLIR